MQLRKHTMKQSETSRFGDFQRILLAALASLVIVSCSPVSYYAQTISGHTGILAGRERIAELLSDKTLDERLRERLLIVTDIVDFAHRELDLPDNGSYRHYADTGRDYVVWNVFAAPQLGLEAMEWCHLFLGCMNYRGYFDRDKAIAYADELEGRGWDVYVGGVGAYSTLGWFRDPVLNTMVYREDWSLARLIFHELAHQILFVPADTAFNEAFADSVAIIGLDRWLTDRPAMDQDRVAALLAHEHEFAALALQTRRQLGELYTSGQPESYQRQHKAIIIENFRQHLSARLTVWQDERFRDWVEGDVNNARLAAISIYRQLVPGFMQIFEETGKDLSAFYEQVEVISRCPVSIRHSILLAETPPRSCSTGAIPRDSARERF